MKHYPFVAALLLGGCGTTDTKQVTKVDAEVCLMCWSLEYKHDIEVEKDSPEPRQEVGP